MESIFKNVDEDKTIEKAESVLKDYWKWKLRARRARFNLQSPAMDGMPQSPSFENHVDEKHVNKLNAVVPILSLAVTPNLWLIW